MRARACDVQAASPQPDEQVGLIKRIKRVGFGFRNLDNYRLRPLLHCGVDWHTPTATPIKGRLSRLVA